MSSLLSCFTGSSSGAAMGATKEKVQSIIYQNQVVVFSKTYCPYCQATKRLLKKNGAQFHVVELDRVGDGSAIKSALADLTGQNTVPNIFIAQQHIGGNSELQARKRELPILLKNAGVV